MPQLDVSFVTSDPMLSDTFTVLRRSDSVGTDGRTTPTVVETFNDVAGVVTQQDPSEIMRREDGQIVPRRIFVASSFAFRGESQSPDGVSNYQPDVIVWDGTEYTVTSALPYQRFGAGITEVVAESGRAVDVPQ